MRFLAILLNWVIVGLSHATPPADVASASVAQVRAYSPGGALTLGSAVIIGSERLATNCHVTRGASRIEIVQDGRALPVALVGGHAVRDVCFLHAPGLSRGPAISAHAARVGQKVIAAGFSAGKPLTLTEGHIVALHDYDGARVIQVSAPFDYGASGGALLDDNGRLLGLLTFKAIAGGSFHFAAPAKWLYGDSGAMNVSGAPFWQRSTPDLPYFLRAASMEANRNWTGLMIVASAWQEREPANPDAGRALAKAHAKLVATSSGQ